VRKRGAALTSGTLACGAIGLALATGGSAQTGCTTHQCDQSSYDYYPATTLPDGGHVPGGGFLVDDTYFTNDIDSNWLTFQGNSTVRIWFPPEVAGWYPYLPVVAVGTDPTPNSVASQDAGFNYTQGVGQLGIFNVENIDTEPKMVNGHCVGGGVSITNSTCATYFAYVEVQFIRSGAGSETIDPLTCSKIPNEAGAGSDSAPAGALADAGTAGSD
jgi:hypothetical protein